MENAEIFKKLLAYNIWADRRTIQLLKEQGGSNPRALSILIHLLVAEAEWLTRITQNSGTPGFNFWVDMSLSDCETLANEVHEKYAGLVSRLNDKKLGEIATYKNSKGVEFRTSWRDVLLHVTMHSAYHRGQVAMAIRDSGGEPVNTDYIGFLRERSEG